MNHTKGTHVPVDQTQGERSNGKRHQDFPNSSFDRPPYFSSISSSSSDPPPPRAPIAGVSGLSRGEASSSNSVPPPPASVLTPPVSSTCPHHLLRQIVPRLLRTRESWWTVNEILYFCNDRNNPEEWESLTTYLHKCAQVGISPDRPLAFERATILGFIAWAGFAINNPLIATFNAPARQPPVSPGDIFFLSCHWPPAPGGRALIKGRLPRPIDLSTDRGLISSDVDPSPWAGDILLVIILGLLSRPEASHEPWWSIDALMEEGIHPPNSRSHMSSALHTAGCLTNYLQALGTIGVAPPEGYSNILAAGLLAWARLPDNRHLVVIFEHDGICGPTAFGRRHRLQHPVMGIGERYYFRLPDRPLTEPNSPATPDSPPPPLPPRDDKGPPINIKGNQDGPPAPSESSALGPDPDPTVNLLLGAAITTLLCFPGPTAQDSYTISELISHTTELSEDMTYAKRYEVILFRQYLELCAAECSVYPGGDHSVLCIGLLRWAKFPRNNLTYICFESHPQASLPGNRRSLKLTMSILVRMHLPLRSFHPLRTRLPL